MSDKPTCSIITPRGEGGIGVILLYGQDALSVLELCFEGTKRRAARIAPGRIAHGTIEQNNKTVDEVVVAHLSEEQSPLGCESYEINCHGGAVAVNTVLECLQDNGAEAIPWRQVMQDTMLNAAEPLSAKAIKGEAFSELPRAETRPALKMLLHQANGALHHKLSEIAKALDENPRDAVNELQNLLQTADDAIGMLQPVKIMLLGPPNAGKSTLLNSLLRKERVIVHPTPGTTRDVVKDRMAINGIPFDIMDSAGIHDGSDELEVTAIDNTLRLIHEADIIFFVFDVRQPDALENVLPKIRQAIKEKQVLYIANKCDLLQPEGAAEADSVLSCLVPLVKISAKKMAGLEGLEGFLTAPRTGLLKNIRDGKAMIFTERQCSAVEDILTAASEEGKFQAKTKLQSMIG